MNNFIKLTFFTFCLFFFNPLNLFAQKNFKPGVIITDNGDKLNGYISAKLKKPTALFFKNDLTSPIQSIDVNKVLDVKFGKSAYRRYSGKITQDYINQTSFSMQRSRDTSFVIDTIFVRVLSEGKNMTLYDYTDNAKTHFFYSDNEHPIPIELIYRLYYNADNANVVKNTGRTINEDTYMQQIFALALKNNVLTDKLKAEIEWLRYDGAYLIPITKKINGVK